MNEDKRRVRYRPDVGFYRVWMWLHANGTFTDILVGPFPTLAEAYEAPRT